MDMNQVKYFTISKKDLLAGLDKALTHYKIAALTKKQDKVLYDYINNSQEIAFSCQPTVLSPKKFFFPQNETLLEYTPEGKIVPKITAEPLVLFGVHPCDINAIKILDEAFSDGNGDPNYLTRRENTVIIGMDCTQVCDKDAFCYKVNAHEAKTGFDAMIYLCDGEYVIAIGSKKGEEFLQQYFTLQESDASAIDAFKSAKEANFKKEQPFKQLDKFPELFEKNKDHPVWEKEASRCLSCGSCIMVCPTCYCFDVADELALSLKKGERLRRWDACMLRDFTLVAGGEVFRDSAKGRLEHRINRKFNYLMKKHGQSVCVGCGRCVRACLADISPKTIAEEIEG